MPHFLEVYHGDCALSYVGVFIEIKRIDFRGLKGPFDVKRANFRIPIAKIGHYGPLCFQNLSMTHFH